MINKFKHLSLLKLLKNIYSLMKYDLHQDTLKLRKELDEAKYSLYVIKLKENILNYYENEPDLALHYGSELEFIRKAGLSVFPYHKIKTLKSIIANYDNILEMPYVMHNHKKLYFPKNWTTEQAVFQYRNYIETENLLGGSFSTKAPHQYQTDSFYIKEGDVLLDIGCAEALIALDAIEKTQKVYLFESDTIWIEPLKATFEPYKEKVVLINKLVSNADTQDTVKLSTALKDEVLDQLFIKMDIEGFEKEVIKDSTALLSLKNDIRIACCTYHQHNDAEYVKMQLESMNYHTEYSDGYMLFFYDELKPPYFRKGMIRAYRKNHTSQ